MSPTVIVIDFGSQVTPLPLLLYFLAEEAPAAGRSALSAFVCGDKLKKCCSDVGQGSNSQ